MGVDIPVNNSFQSYANHDNLTSQRACSFQSYQTLGRHYASCQLSKLTTLCFRATIAFTELPKSCQQWELTSLLIVVFRATKIPTTLRADFPVAFRATKNLQETMLLVKFLS